MTKRKKVLLVSLWGYDNYGNRLQMLALKKMVEKMGYQATCVQYCKDDIVSFTEHKIKEFLGFLGISKYRKNYIKRIRARSLKKGQQLYEPITKKIYRGRTAGIINPNHYYAALTGSDQVWHRWCRWNDLPFFYLSFMQPEKRISYAASFGFNSFPAKDFRYHQNGLLGMHLISCREETGCKLVEQMTGKPGKLVLDPTLCIDHDFWENLEMIPSFKVPSRYILVFMLGNKGRYMDEIKLYSLNHHLEIVDLNDYNRKDVWKTSVSSFLWLIHHADYICTDSFHGTAFCIIYEKKFMTFRRVQKNMENMFDRIETLLRQLRLEDREYKGEYLNNDEIDYKLVKSKLEPLREESIDWLQNALQTVRYSETDI